WTFALGCGLAALGGALGADILAIDPGYALENLIYFLIVVAVGGLGSIRGPFFAALLLGIADTGFKYLLPEFGAFFIYRRTRHGAACRRGAAPPPPPSGVGTCALARRRRRLFHLSGLPGARRADPDFDPLRAVDRPHPGICWHHHAWTIGLLRRRRLCRRAAGGAWLGRAAERAGRRRAGRCRAWARQRRHHSAHSGAEPPHAHPGDRRHAAGGGEQGRQHHRRRRWAAGHGGMAALRRIPFRPLWPHRLSLQPRRALPRLAPGAAPGAFALRPLAHRHSRERSAHARDRLAGVPPTARDLHHRRRARRRRRRAARRDDAVRGARSAGIRTLGLGARHADHWRSRSA